MGATTYAGELGLPQLWEVTGASLPPPPQWDPPQPKKMVTNKLKS